MVAISWGCIRIDLDLFKVSRETHLNRRVRLFCWGYAVETGRHISYLRAVSAKKASWLLLPSLVLISSRCLSVCCDEFVKPHSGRQQFKCGNFATVVITCANLDFVAFLISPHALFSLKKLCNLPGFVQLMALWSKASRPLALPAPDSATEHQGHSSVSCRF